MAFGDVIRSAPSPSTRPYGIGGNANTIWHCDADTNRVYELSTADFSVIRSAAGPSGKSYGIGGDTDTIWHCDEMANKVYELSTIDFSVIRSADSTPVYPMGIGGKADTIWHCNFWTLKIYELSTVGLGVIRSAPSPSTEPYGIGGNANTIWHCDSTDYIYELSTADFSVIRSAGSPSILAFGIGGDTDTIWHCDIYADKIYELDAAVVVVPTVTTNAATSVGTTSSTLNGTLANDGGEACQCGFEWGETDAYEHGATPTDSKTTSETFSQVIIGLDPNTTYHFRAFATNSAGTSHGADRTFTTEALPPAVIIPTVTTNPATLISQVSATLNGLLNDDGGEACACGFEWGLTDAYGHTTLTESKVTGESSSRAIGGLTPGTTYHFRAFATNSAGTGYGADRSFTSTPTFSRAHALSREEL